MSQNENDFQLKVGHTAYEADWINNSAAMKTAVQMITMRSQRLLKVTGVEFDYFNS